MKKVAAILFLLSSSIAYADLVVICYDEGSKSSFLFPESKGLLVDYGRIIHNFATATVVCKNQSDIERRVAARESFTCGGVWHHDFQPMNHREIDTPVQIEFAFYERAYRAHFQTSNSYGSKMIKMACEIHDE